MSYTVDLSTVPTTELAAPAIGVVVLEQQGYGPPGPPGGAVAHAATHASGGSDPLTDVVHLAGAESIGGAKTFTSPVLGAYPSIDVGATQHGVQSTRTVTYTANSAAADQSAAGNFGTSIAGAGNKTAAVIRGLTGVIDQNGTGTVNEVRGLQSQINTAASAGTIATARGASIGFQPLSPITLAFGLAISGMNTAQIAAGIGIDVGPVNGGTGNGVGIRVALPKTAALQLSYDADSVLPAGGIYFGASFDTSLYRSAPSTLKTNGKLVATTGLGVGNSAAATTPGTVVRKMEVFDAAGASLGFVPIYNTIT